MGRLRNSGIDRINGDTDMDVFLDDNLCCETDIDYGHNDGLAYMGVFTSTVHDFYVYEEKEVQNPCEKDSYSFEINCNGENLLIEIAELLIDA